MCDVIEVDGESYLYLEDEDVLVAEDGTEIYLEVEDEDPDEDPEIYIGYLKEEEDEEVE